MVFDFILGPAYDATAALAGLVGAAPAIVLLTLLVRLALLPLGIRQAKLQRIRQRLAPDLAKIQKRHAKDPERMAREVRSLYAGAGTSMFAGVGTGLAQIPFVFVLYNLFTHPVIAGQQNVLMTHSALSVPLSEHLGAVVAQSGLFGGPTLVFVGLLVLIALVAWQSSRLVIRTAEMPGSGLLKLLPYGTVLAAAFLPFATGVYLLISTAWTTTERRLLTA
ncbi:membrane protein insertase YidC [Herbidospora galbida]|uniref:Membrane protein insertase YidC n=1 Tax=Herbidospora galbida TaxID=2575442 RepID=A0A4U3M9P4_9ACTN|nr:membrane protein insertase YidC [Herbidospora galbida]